MFVLRAKLMFKGVRIYLGSRMQENMFIMLIKTGLPQVRKWLGENILLGQGKVEGVFIF